MRKPRCVLLPSSLPPSHSPPHWPSRLLLSCSTPHYRPHHHRLTPPFPLVPCVCVFVPRSTGQCGVVPRAIILVVVGRCFPSRAQREREQPPRPRSSFPCPLPHATLLARPCVRVREQALDSAFSDQRFDSQGWTPPPLARRMGPRQGPTPAVHLVAPITAAAPTQAETATLSHPGATPAARGIIATTAITGRTTVSTVRAATSTDPTGERIARRSMTQQPYRARTISPHPAPRSVKGRRRRNRRSLR